MPASSLIFLVIVVLWAAYLVPAAIKKHRRTASARQADRDSEAMRVVVRRGSAPVGQALAAAAANAVGSSSRPVLGPGPGSVAAQSFASSIPMKSLGRSTSAVVTRRRRLLGVAAGLTVLGWTVVAAGLASWWSGALPTLGLLLVVAALTRHGATAPARSVLLPAEAVLETTAVLPAARPPVRVGVPAPRADKPSPLAGDRGWAPVEVPLPTYLLKDKARTWEPLRAEVSPEILQDEHPTQVIDLREHARAVNE